MLEKIRDIQNGSNEEKLLNLLLMLGWTGIQSVLIIAYLVEVIKGVFSIVYYIHFLIASMVPYGVCLYRFVRQRKNLKNWIVVCYCMMYSFVLLTGHTMLVFTYIFPILMLLMLYHDPKVIRLCGGITLILNVLFILRDGLRGRITLVNSRDYEIQMSLLVLSFVGSYMATELYNRINRIKNSKEQEVMRLTVEQKFINLDYLTGLANRKKFDESLEAAVNEAFQPFYLISLDINGLKRCNDTLGHLAGDELIIGAAQCMKRAFDDAESECFRISGDEFCIICRCDQVQFGRKCALLQENIAKWSGKSGYKLSAAIGFIYVDEPMEVRKLLHLADEQMYREKEKYYLNREHDRRSR